MKTLLLLLLPFLFACNQQTSKYKFAVRASNGKGMDWSATTIRCDSVSIINTKEAVCWVDGIKIIVKAENYVSVYSND